MIKNIYFLIGITLILNSCIDSAKKPTKRDTVLKKQVENITILKKDNSKFLGFQNKNTTALFSLKGSVTSIVQTNYWFKNNNKIPKKIKTDLFEFNPQKQLTLYNRIADDGELFFTNNYVYDQENYLTNYFESNEVRFVVSTIPTYSTDKLIIKEKHFNKDEISIGYSIFDFQEPLQIITKSTTWVGGKTKNKVLSKIDSKGNVVLNMKYESVLNKDFSLAAETVNEYTYNDQNLVLEERQYNPWGMFENYKDRLYMTIQNEYGANNLCIKRTYVKKDGTIDYVLTYLYKLDSRKNWIEKTIIKNEEKESFFLRKITYFE